MDIFIFHLKISSLYAISAAVVASFKVITTGWTVYFAFSPRGDRWLRQAGPTQNATVTRQTTSYTPIFNRAQNQDRKYINNLQLVLLHWDTELKQDDISSKH